MPRIRPYLFHLAWLLCAALGATPTWAHQPPEAVEAAARDVLEREARGLPGEVEIDVGTFDPANQLPPCASLQAFVPHGARAWGRLSVAVRCDSPVVWTVYLPAQVSVITDYLVTVRPLHAGHILGPDDVRRERGDLAAQPADTLTELSQAVGSHTRHAIATDSPVRRNMLRLPPAVSQGQTVKVVGAGSGFNVSSEGRALNRAAAGESVRVRLDSGQVITGTARAGGVVELRF